MKVKKKELREALNAGIMPEDSSNYWAIRNELVAKCMLHKIELTDTIKVSDLIDELDKAEARYDKAIDKYLYKERS